MPHPPQVVEFLLFECLLPQPEVVVVVVAVVVDEALVRLNFLAGPGAAAAASAFSVFLSQ